MMVKVRRNRSMISVFANAGLVVLITFIDIITLPISLAARHQIPRRYSAHPFLRWEGVPGRSDEAVSYAAT